MIVTMIAVRVVKVVVHQAINMIRMRHGWVSTGRSVAVVFLMAVTVVPWRAGSRVLAACFDLMFNHALGSHVMQVTIVKVIAVAIVFDRRMATARTVLMLVIAVY